MNTKSARTPPQPSSPTSTQIGAAGAPEQLTLLSTPTVPLQFRLDERTRRSGLQHVAVLRAQIAAQAERRRVGEPKPAAPRRAAA